MKRLMAWASADFRDWTPAHYVFFGVISAAATAFMGVAVFLAP